MRILLVTDTYPPEIGSGAELMRGLAAALSERGHEVVVLTTSPNYKLSQNDVGKVWPEIAVEEVGSIVRSSTFAIHHVGYIRRGLGVLIAPFQMWMALRRHFRGEFDAAFIYSPPITLGLIGLLLKRRRTGIVFNVQDIFPQNAIDLGILRNPVLIALFRWIERLSYRKADVITAHSRSNLEMLTLSNPDFATKFRVLHNWIDVASFTVQRGTNYRQLFGLEGKFVALFAGVIGPSQGIHMLMEVAAKVRDLENFVFLIVGDGTEKQRAEGLVRSLKLKNVLFKPFISQDDYPDLLASSNVGLTCLSTDVKTPVVPGKLLGHMVASLPVAAFVNAESDVHQLVADARCGDSCISSDIAKMERILRNFHNNQEECRTMGMNGRQYAIEHFSIDRITSDIEHMMEEIRPIR